MDVLPDVPQLSAAAKGAGSEVSEGGTSLLVSTESSCMASCTASLSSETEAILLALNCFYAKSRHRGLSLAIPTLHVGIMNIT